MGKFDKSDFQKIPCVGDKTEEYLLALGYKSIADLKGESPEKIYERDCNRQGFLIDRCQLYVYRLAVYYAENTVYDPEKLKWWYWKDKGGKENENN